MVVRKAKAAVKKAVAAKAVVEKKATKVTPEKKATPVEAAIKTRDKKLYPAVDENPFKRGWSKDTWEQIVASPGKTYRQYVNEGGRVQSIAHAVKVGWLRAE